MKKPASFLGLGLALGAGIGAATGHIAMGVAMGMVFAVALRATKAVQNVPPRD